ncbi:hypothetical protein [Desulfonema magnum]|uniref:Uncharacterized protein n=1 Tax=Desulfonema magnum TaxID=45655 RepID=A0A975BWM1_9BACT|nr:hypothetical protein [Desulfonema magnum]QTA92867.1 Uncharacterized protein dnm_089600 [Desulfonema magnum]
MILHDKTYRLPGVGRWAHAWRVRVIDLSVSQPDMIHFRPVILFAVRSKGRILKTNCAESLGKWVCKELKLDIEHLLWIEHFPNTPEPMRVAKFQLKPLFGDDIYSVQWRPAISNEIQAIRPFIPDIENITINATS